MEQNEFCDRVLALVRHATTEEKEAIRTELLGHMEDHAAALVERGKDPDAALALAAQAMGDPEEVGRELDKQYPLVWLAVSRIALILSILVGIAMLFHLPLTIFPFSNIQARTQEIPMTLDNLHGSCIYTVDLRTDVGSDVLRVFGVGLEPFWDGETATVNLAMCNYDRNPFGQACGTLLNYLTYEVDGEAVESRSGGGASNAGAAYWFARNIAVSRKAEYIAVCYDRFGTKVRLEVPLNWEGAE